MDDQAELQRELSWRDPAPERDDRRLAIRPRGTNVIFGIGGVLWVSGLGLYLRWFGPVNTKNGVSPVIACMVAMGCWLGVSHLLSRRIWVAAGPSVRAGLRPFGLLGPIPAAIILVAIIGAAIGVAQRA